MARQQMLSVILTTLAAAALAAAAPASEGDPAPRRLRSPDKLFAATCATCHGADGLGGFPSWVDPQWITPPIAFGIPIPGMTFLEEFIRFTVRNGPYNNGGFKHVMPAFGREVISDQELDDLIRWLIYAPPIGGSNMRTGAPPPPKPAGHEILLEILDEAPWYRDDGTDSRDPFGDRRRVVLSPGDYIKVRNHGRTWHTVTNREFGIDTGFIGHAHNIPTQDVGYFYLELSDLQPGAWKYLCSLHPYMQVEIVTPEASPAPLTHASKLPLRPPPTPGVGEVWVGMQTWPNPGGPNGAVDVIDASDWSRTLIPGVGNNPHNGWIGTSRDEQDVLRNVVTFANWHDVTLSVIDADSKVLLGSALAGAANAHVMTAPSVLDPATGATRWFVTVMGSNKVQEFDPFEAMFASWNSPPSLSQSDGLAGKPAFSPHGLWFVDSGLHFLTANTLGSSASLYSLTEPWADRVGRVGIGCEVANADTGGKSPLAASILNTGSQRPFEFTGYTNNAGTDDISVFAIDATPGAQTLTRLAVPPPLGNAAGNVALTNTSAQPVRWSHMPIQCTISPPGATAHGRFMLVCNKASFNVSVLPLDARGRPQGIYTFPAGLGAHGVGFGRKDTSSGPPRVAYYAYVTNTFENYVSVYDLELLEQLIALEQQGQAPPEFGPGAASERVRIEGLAANVLLGLPAAVVPLTLFSPDARGLVHVGDVALSSPAEPGPRCYLQEHVWIDRPLLGMTLLDLDLTTSTGAMGVFCRPLPPPWN